MLRLGLPTLVLLLTLAAPGAAEAQTADAYFHRAAQAYIAEDRAQAKAAVEDGLKVAPDDPRLLALQAKLTQPGRQPESDSTGQQSGTSSESSNSEGGGSGQEGGEASEDGEQGRGQPGPEGEEDPRGPEPQSQRGEQGSPRPGDGEVQGRRTRSGNDGTPRPQRGLSMAQAERILRALEGQEKQLLREVQARDARPEPVEKDW